MTIRLEKGLIMFRTNDLGLTAAFMTLGITPRETKKEKGKVYFLFDDTEEIQEIASSYFNMRLAVDAYTFSNNIKAAKQNVFRLIDND